MFLARALPRPPQGDTRATADATGVKIERPAKSADSKSPSGDFATKALADDKRKITESPGIGDPPGIDAAKMEEPPGHSKKFHRGIISLAFMDPKRKFLENFVKQI